MSSLAYAPDAAPDQHDAQPARSDALGWLARHATLAAAVLVGALAVLVTWPGFRELQADSYRLLYVGRNIVAHGLAHHWVFSAAGSGRAYADQQWLAELADYGLVRSLGYGGLVAVNAGVFALGFGLLAALIRRRGATLPLAIGCALTAVVASLSLTFVRAQLYAIPLFVMVLWLCLDDLSRGAARRRRRVLLVVPLLVLWANLHGSVLVGASLGAGYFGLRAVSTSRAGRRGDGWVYGAAALACGLSPFATPYGTGVLAYYGHMIGNKAVVLADIEWGSPAFGTLGFFQFLLPVALCVLAVGWLVVRRHRVPWLLVAGTAVTACAAWFAMRNNLWLAIIAAVLLGEAAAAWRPTGKGLRVGFVGAVWVAALAALVLDVGQVAARPAGAYAARAPVHAVSAAAAAAGASRCRIVNGDNTSVSALLWLHPELVGRVAFDGELEVYSQPDLRRWVAFQAARGPGWRSDFGGASILVGALADQPGLVGRLQRLPGARVLASDGRGTAVELGSCDGAQA